MPKFSKEADAAMKRRGDMFRSLPVSDWHQIIAFETIIQNYMKMIGALKRYEDEQEKSI